MSWADRLRRFFSTGSSGASKQSKAAGKEMLRALEHFATTRKGVEGYIEPQTTTQPTTLLLVDRDGDSARAPVGGPAEAARFCDKRGIPVYDARVIGYPRRMVEFERRHGRTSPDEPDYDAEIADLERRLSETGDEA